MSAYTGMISDESALANAPERREMRLVDAVSFYRDISYVPPSRVPRWLIAGVSQSPFESDAIRSADAKALACKVTDALFTKLSEDVSGKLVVPVSGGWDSRLILAELAARFDSSEIVAVSFGRPGQLDFDIGKLVAKHAGVEHHAYELDNVAFDWTEICEVAAEAPWTYWPDCFYHRKTYGSVLNSDCRSLWIGFLGEALTGGHYRGPESGQDPGRIERSFLLKQKRGEIGRLESGTRLASLGMGAMRHAPLSYGEFLDFAARQLSGIAPVVLPGGKWEGWSALQGDVGCSSTTKVVAPFCDKDWARFWLHLPRKHHEGQRLYLAMAMERHPKLFGLPSKYSYGKDRSAKVQQQFARITHGLRRRTSRYFPFLSGQTQMMENYMNLARAFRIRDDCRDVLERAIVELKEKELVSDIDPERICREHASRRHDHTESLKVLVGLAINLRVNADGETIRNNCGP